MTGNTALIIFNIIIIGIIAVIIVKLYYNEDDKDKEIKSLADLRPSFLDKNKGQIESTSNLDDISVPYERTPLRSEARAPESTQTRRKSPSRNRPPAHKRLSEDIRSSKAAVSPNRDPEMMRKQQTTKSTHETPKPAVEKPVSVIKKENEVYNVNEEKVLKEKEPQTIKPVTEVPETKEPEKSEDLKDLFTIDELIKESKRKDSEKIQASKENTINTPIEEETSKAEIVPEVKTVEETANVEEVVTEIDEEPIIKTIDAEIAPDEYEIEEEKLVTNEPVNLVQEEETQEEYADLDYRKDLEKIKNVVKNSKFLSDIKNKISPEVSANEAQPSKKNFRRSVGDFETNEYENSYYDDFDADDWEPIIPELQPDYEYEERENRPLTASERLDEDLRLKNTRKVYNMAKPKTETKLEKPMKKVQITSVSFTLNNEEVTLNKNDEIIYKVYGETYSSRVLAIQGDDIIVRYRGKNKTINIDAVKKIY